MRKLALIGCGCLVWIVIITMFICACIIFYICYMQIQPAEVKIPRVVVETPKVQPIDIRPIEHITSVPMDRYLKLEEINGILNNWNKEVHNLCQLDSIGKTKKGTEILCLRITQHQVPLIQKKNVLIHSCIHGNERIAASCCLGFMEQLLLQYGRDKLATEVLLTRNIYFIPVLSVDSYVERQRHVENVDPNRSYPCPEEPGQVSPMPCLLAQKFCDQIGFSAIMSGHSYGRVYLYPRFGPDQDEIGALARDMGTLSKYNARIIGGQYPARAHDSRGFEIDWYYWKGGATSILTEFGTGSHDMAPKQLKPEMERNIEAWKLFIAKGPEIKLAEDRTPKKVRENINAWEEEE